MNSLPPLKFFESNSNHFNFPHNFLFSRDVARFSIFPLIVFAAHQPTGALLFRSRIVLESNNSNLKLMVCVCASQSIHNAKMKSCPRVGMNELSGSGETSSGMMRLWGVLFEFCLLLVVDVVFFCNFQ